MNILVQTNAIYNSEYAVDINIEKIYDETRVKR